MTGTAMQIVRFAWNDWRIRFVGGSPAYWYYSRPFATLRDCQNAVATIEAARS